METTAQIAPRAVRPASTELESLDAMLGAVLKEGASDLILKTGSCPAIRVDGRVRFLSDQPIPHEFSIEVLERVLTPSLRELFLTRGEVDTAYQFDPHSRFRVNVFRQQGHVGFSLRHVREDVQTIRDLCLPAEQLERLATLSRGLVLATGVAGSGKSTTLASMVQYINLNCHKHIVTVEDPIEFVHRDRKCVVTQREIGSDTLDFHSALKSVVRQTPDVILIGEMRDRETMEAALSAAETGHLVLSTLHTVNAVQTVERIISFFPPHQHGLIRQQLSMTLEGVISLRLISKKDRTGRVPAVELLLGTPTIREMLAEGRTRELNRAIHDGADYFGTQTFNQSLVKLLKENKIAHADALSAADNPDELKLEMRGIAKGGKADFDFDY